MDNSHSSIDNAAHAEPVDAAAQVEPTGVAGATTQMMAQVASAVASKTDLDDVTAAIVQSLTDMGALGAAVFLLQPEQGVLVLSAQKGLPRDLVERLSSVSMDAPLATARAAAQRQIQVVADSEALNPTQMRTRDLLHETGARSMIAAPLIAFNTLVGVLAWGQARPLKLTPEEEGIIRSIAEVFAVGIVNANNAAALRRGNKRFWEIIETAPIGMSLLDLNGRFLRSNRPFCELIGYSEKELAGMRLKDITHPEDVETDLGLVEKLLRGEIPRIRLPKRYIRKDGRVIHVILNVGLIHDEGETRSFIAHMIDVTEARKHEEDLKQSEAGFRLLAEHANDLVYRFRIGELAGFEYVSPSALRITGYTPEQLYANPQLGRKVVYPGDRHFKEHSGDTATDHAEAFIHRFVRKDAKQRWLEVSNTPVFDAAGNVVAIEGIARDITDRKETEEALRESEERLRFIVEHSPDAIFIQDKGLRYIWVGNTMPGYAPEEFLGKTDYDLVSLKDAAKISNLKLSVMESNKEIATVNALTYKGKTSHFDVRYAPWHDKDGNVIGVAGYLRDVTQSKLVEAALRESEENLRLAQSIAHIGSWDWDLATNQVRWSPETYRIYGLPPDLLLDFPALVNVIAEDERASFVAKIQKALSVGGHFETIQHNMRSDGQVRLLHGVGKVIGKPGEPERMVGSVQDITEQHALETERERLLQALEQEKRWMEKLIEHSPVGIALFDQEGKVRFNKQAESLFGRKLRQGQGPSQYAHQVFTPDGKPVPIETLGLARVARGEFVESPEYLIKRPDGSTVYIRGTGTAIFDDGRAAGGIIVMEDVTPVRRLARMREEWIGVIVHDLRQPLSAMSLQAELLKERCGDQGDSAKAVASLLAAIRRMNGMAQELLDASVIEAKRVELHAERHDLRVLTAVILGQGNGLRVEPEFKSPDEPVLAFVDPQRYEQILVNLLTNAAKYGKADRPIRVELASRGPYVVVSVTNEGAGIQAAELPNLFDRYWRSERGKTQAQGIGLGLYIVKGLVEAHGGKVWAESTPGETTTISFELPKVAPH